MPEVSWVKNVNLNSFFKTLQNPDELQKHPEITALYEELDRP